MVYYFPSNLRSKYKNDINLNDLTNGSSDTIHVNIMARVFIYRDSFRMISLQHTIFQQTKRNIIRL